MKPIDVKPSTYIDFNKENEGLKLEVRNHVRILKYKDIFAKYYVLSWSEEVFVVKRVKNTCCRHTVKSVNTSWVYMQTKDNFEEPTFGRGGLYSGGKTLQFAIC